MLDVLVHAEGPLSANEIARRAGLSRGGAASTLRTLAADGPVWEACLAHAGLFILDPEHLVTPILRQLAAVVDELVRRIGEHAKSWTLAPAWVGLVDPARSTDPRTVTLVVVRPGRVDAADPRWVADRANLAERAARWTGNEVVVHELGEGDAEPGLDVGAESVLTAFGRPPGPLRSYTRPEGEAGDGRWSVDPMRLHAVPWADALDQ